MEIKFSCRDCGQHISAAAEEVGRTGTCPSCGKSVTVADASLPQPTPPPAATTAVGVPRRSPRNKILLYSGLGCGGLLAVLFIMVLVAVFSSSSSGPSSGPSSRRIEDVLTAQLQASFEPNKQKIFDSIHPVGTAKSVTVHDVTVDVWKHGQNTNRFEDIQQLTVRYTLYWEGWITKDGYTKISQTYDAESQRYTAQNILATNGITNSNVFDISAGVLQGVIQQTASDYINNNQQSR